MSLHQGLLRAAQTSAKQAMEAKNKGAQGELLAIAASEHCFAVLVQQIEITGQLIADKLTDVMVAIERIEP